MLRHTVAIESNSLFDINSEPYLSWRVYNSEVCSRIINDAVRCWGLNRISEQRNIMAYDWSNYMGELVLKGKSKNQFITQTKKFVIEYDEI